MSSSSWISAGLRTVADYFGDEEQEVENLTIVHESSSSSSTSTNTTSVLAAGSSDGSSKRKAADAAPSEEDFLAGEQQQQSASPEKKRLKETALNHAQEEEEKADEMDAKLPADIAHAHGSSSVAGNSDQSLEPVFQTKLDELKAYIALHGHMNISHSDEHTRPLYSWIQMQRLRKRALPKRYGSRRAMTLGELDALNAIGFDWTPLSSVVKSPRASQVRAPAPPRPKAISQPPQVSGFWKKFEELKAFKAKFGHLNVKSSGKYVSLYSWMHMQKQLFKAFPRRYYKDKRAMTQEQKDALDSIGFVWETPAVAQPQPSAIEPKNGFWKKFEELKAFKAQHGHLNVRSSGKYVRLYSWMHKQKQLAKKFPNRYYKDMRAMTQKEKNALDSIGFVWEPASTVQSVVKPQSSTHAKTTIVQQSKSSTGTKSTTVEQSQSSKSTETKSAIVEQSQLSKKGAFWQNFDLLKEFKEKNGHVDVRYEHSKLGSKYDKLYKWVHMQRKLASSYPARFYEDRRAMTKEERDALDSIGFVWM